MDNILEQLKGLPGHVGFYFKNLNTGEILYHNENDEYIPASVIKLPVLMAIFLLADRGEADLKEYIKIKHGDKMPSCGALSSFSDEPEVDVRTLCNLMITISDNTATNILISHYGTGCLNEVFEEMGLEKTRVNRRLFDSEASQKGIQNSITPKEMGFLMEKLYRNEFVSKAVSEEIKEILCRQQINHKLKEMLPPGTKAAHKTGEDDYISNDVGIVYSNEPFIVSFISNETDIHIFNTFIRETTYKLFQKCNM